jgi:hypothetical protein
MNFPFGEPILEDNIQKNHLYLFNPVYKVIPVGKGELPKFMMVIDWDATARHSAVIYNIGGSNK